MPHAVDAEAASLPFVSVVIPVKNGEGKLEHCLRALGRQSYPAANYEVVVADAASRDRTVEIARAAGARVIENPRLNPSAGRNLGIAAAQGTLIAILDDDCVPSVDWLACGVAALEAGGYDALGGPLPMPEGSSAWSRAVDWVFDVAARGGSVQSGRTRSELAEDIPAGNALYRRSALEAVGPYDEGLWAEDVDLHLRLRKSGKRLGFCADFVAAHHRQDTPQGFYGQMRRYAIGRVQIFRKHRQGVKPAHLAVSGLGTLACLAAIPWPGFVLLGCGATSLALCGAGLVGGVPLASATLLGPALVVFVAGWTVGTWSELLLPRRATTGW